MQLNSVVLPAPFGPIRAQISAARTVHETPSSARTPPKRTETSSTRSNAACTRPSSHGRCAGLAVILSVAGDAVHPSRLKGSKPLVVPPVRRQVRVGVDGAPAGQAVSAFAGHALALV